MMEVLQVASELAPMLDLYRDVAPARVLEIGCWDGGTLREWLNGNPELVVAVDLEHRNRQAYEDWRMPGTELLLFTGSSLEHEQIVAIQDNAPYDWVFVDGDHADEAVRHDVAVCLPLVRKGGHLLLHDITGAPGAVLDELEADYPVRRLVDPKDEPWTHGIGIVQL